MFENLGVGGILSFDVGNAVRNMMGASSALGKLEGGFGSILGPLGKIAGLLGAGIGIASLAHHAFAAQTQFEDMQTTLGTTFNVLSGGGHVEQAFALAKKEMREIDTLATKSPAQAADLLNIYKQIVGPMSAAGHSLKEVRDMTLGATIAAKGLGVDYSQIGHTLYKLEAGTANQHDQVFQILRAQGLITVEAAEWNALVPVERHKRITEIMAKYLQSADKVGQTWSALKESSEDAFKIVARATIEPVFNRMKGVLSKIVQYVFANREQVEKIFSGIGEKIGAIWDFAADLIGGFVDEIGNYIDEIKAPLMDAWESIRESLKLLGFQFFDTLDAGQASAGTFGRFLAYIFGTVAQAAAKVFGTIANMVSFTLYTVANIQYAFQVAGQRIGETFGMIYLAIKNVFIGLYDIAITPVRLLLEAVTSVIDAIASTKIGAMALDKAGFDTGARKFFHEQVSTILNGKLSFASLDSIAGFGDLPESPEEKMRRDEANSLTKQAKVEVKAEINTNLKLSVDGRNIAAAQAKHQLDLKERAGANDAPWQRRGMIVNAATK